MAKTGSKSNGGGGKHTAEQPPIVAIVDDDASVRQSTARLVRSFGYRVEVFATGDELLSSAAPAIVRALKSCDWILGGPKGAAALLGLKRTTLQARMQKLGIIAPRFRRDPAVN